MWEYSFPFMAEVNWKEIREASKGKERAMKRHLCDTGKCERKS
jgi:hypothetical protein